LFLGDPKNKISSPSGISCPEATPTAVATTGGTPLLKSGDATRTGMPTARLTAVPCVLR